MPQRSLLRASHLVMTECISDVVLSVSVGLNSLPARVVECTSPLLIYLCQLGFYLRTMGLARTVLNDLIPLLPPYVTQQTARAASSVYRPRQRPETTMTRVYFGCNR